MAVRDARFARQNRAPEFPVHMAQIEKIDIEPRSPIDWRAAAMRNIFDISLGRVSSERGEPQEIDA